MNANKRAIVTARAVAAGRTAPRPNNVGRPATNLLARPTRARRATGAVRKSHALKLTPVMASGDGTGRSAWTRTPYLRTDDPAMIGKWDATVSTHP